jgi:hypothetical protein
MIGQTGFSGGRDREGRDSGGGFALQVNAARINSLDESELKSKVQRNYARILVMLFRYYAICPP